MLSEERRKLPLHKGVYILPNLITTASMCAAFVGMVVAVEGRFELAALTIFVSAVLDGLDGKIARLTKSASEFGVQYDSLADVVAFGVGPALILYLWQLQDFGRLGMMACFLFIACGALRLARFNVQAPTSSKRHFVGLPIPAAGCTLAALILFSAYLPRNVVENVLPHAALVLVYALSFLMVSKIRYASFKEYGWFKTHPFGAMVSVLLVFVLIASEPKLLAFVFLLGYVVFGIFYTFFVLARKHPGLGHRHDETPAPEARKG